MNKQLTMFDTSDGVIERKSCSLTNSVSERKSCSLTNSVSEQKTAKFRAIQRFLDNGEKEAIACVNTYKAGNRNNHSYYRLSYRKNKKVKHIHIPGGNTLSDLAKYRAKSIQALIDRGAELAEIIAMVRDFRGSRN